MKKLIGISLSMVFLAGSVGFASPLTDYSAGKVAIEVGFQSPTIIENNHQSVSGVPDADGKNTFDFGVTAGLGNKLALQYKSCSSKSKDTSYYNITTFNTKVDINEYNVLYKLDKNISAFTGIAQVKATQNTSGNADTDGGSISTDDKNIWQFGLIGSIPIADKTSAYASLAYGKDLSAYQLGVSYEVAKNLELDLYYGYSNYKNLQWNDGNGSSDFKVKGVGYGVTYKF